MQRSVDVAIIGGGLAGNLLARQLLEGDIDVAVLPFCPNIRAAATMSAAGQSEIASAASGV